MNFFQDLLKLYSSIKFPNQYLEISKVDKAISWYYGDTANQYITLTKTENNNIIEIDIRQAFTTICKCLFEPSSDFIIEMNKIQDKKARNIFIATSLVNSEHLRVLNIICKVIIMGILFETSNDIILLELKKDGATISCDDETLTKLMNIHEHQFGNFSKSIIDNNFKFHFTQYDKYIRSNRTSYFWDGNVLNIKGTYKHIPPKLNEIQKKILEDEFDDFQNILKIYSKLYFNILTTNNLMKLLKEYYLCDNERYLADDGKYVTKLNNSNINPRNYLKTFIYPIMLSTKI
jgi:hypothetical protein